MPVVKKDIKISLSTNNVVIANNFMAHQNQRFSPTFYYDPFLSKNRFDLNYWENANNSLYLIFGRIDLFNVALPWLNIDWHPAKKPYDIPRIAI